MPVEHWLGAELFLGAIAALILSLIVTWCCLSKHLCCCQKSTPKETKLRRSSSFLSDDENQASVPFDIVPVLVEQENSDDFHYPLNNGGVYYDGHASAELVGSHESINGLSAKSDDTSLSRHSSDGALDKRPVDGIDYYSLQMTFSFSDDEDANDNQATSRHQAHKKFLRLVLLDLEGVPVSDNKDDDMLGADSSVKKNVGKTLEKVFVSVTTLPDKRFNQKTKFHRMKINSNNSNHTAYLDETIRFEKIFQENESLGHIRLRLYASANIVGKLCLGELLVPWPYIKQHDGPFGIERTFSSS